MADIDQMLERVYQRLGWRIIAVLDLVVLAAGTAVIAAFLVLLRRPQDTSWAETGELFAIWCGLAMLGGVVAISGAIRSVGPLIAWLRACPRDDADAASVWALAIRLPIIITRWNTGVAALLICPVLIAAVAIVADLQTADVIWISVSAVWGGALVTSGGYFAAQLVMRPIVCDVAAHLRDPTPTLVGVSVRRKLLWVVPVGLGVAAAFGVAITVPADRTVGEQLPELFVAIVLVSLFAVPVALLLAYTTLRPLDDLLEATQRLKRGDYTTRVPELSADEYGVLARTFNEAMQGLADRERLARENEQLLDEVTASRARIVAASDAERRRVERNIHDGAQQQLVALALKLRGIEDKTTDPETRTALQASNARLKTALQELRDLARGLHPSILTTDGLSPALEQLALRSPIPVAINVSRERFPEAVESAAYFFAAEGLTNIAKYAAATRAEITVERRDGAVTIEVADDGVGGAGKHVGSGLTGLDDRINALGGQFSVDSPAGGGTRLRAALPLEGFAATMASVQDDRER